MRPTLTLELVTPERREPPRQIEAISLLTASGEMMVYPGHQPLVTALRPGVMTVLCHGQTEVLAMGEGFAMITQDRVAIATDLAIGAADLDEVKLEEARRQAEERLRNNLSAEEVATVNANLTRTLAQLKAKRRHLALP